jgi:hypothetical protein
MIELSRINYAQKYLDDARMLFAAERYNSAISRLYYASYQAMWAALGAPVGDRIWRHLAIIKPFVHGYWFDPAHPPQAPGLLEQFRLPLRQLYTLRVRADYDLLEIKGDVVDNMIKLVGDVINTVLVKRSVSQ